MSSGQHRYPLSQMRYTPTDVPIDLSAFLSPYNSAVPAVSDARDITVKLHDVLVISRSILDRGDPQNFTIKTRDNLETDCRIALFASAPIGFAGRGHPPLEMNDVDATRC